MEFDLQRLTLGLILILLSIGTTGTLALKRDDRFCIHPTAYAYLDCSACVAFAEHLGGRMNDSLKFAAGGCSSVLTTHRLSEDNKLKRSDYASSEIRAAEVLEKICSDSLETDFVLRLDMDRRIRVYQSGKSTQPFAQFYSLQDSRAIKDVAKHAVLSFCQRVMSEEEDAVTIMVRELRSLRDVQWRLCGGDERMESPSPEDFTGSITNACVDTATSKRLEVGRIERYEKWQRSISKKRDDVDMGSSKETKEAIPEVPDSSESTENKHTSSEPAKTTNVEDFFFDGLDL